MSDTLQPDEKRRIDLFFRALEEEDPMRRAAFLDSECGDEPDLRAWVEAEIERQTGSSTADGPPPGESGAGEPPLTPAIEALLASLKPEEAGEQIGAYRLVEQLGEGGFGTVWMAVQEKPIRRDVALKILKPGMDSRPIVRRFAQEQQALAMLDHPGVAKVFDAGATPTGRPYFAMELVRGEAITDYCDSARLSVPARVELLMRVCYAVQHAHQKGIIHRDLKPSNILVTKLEDGMAVPKVIDLGLAKAMHALPGEHTVLFTQAERMIGTPLYMSPEQAEGSADIDTRADIYALGVVLYQLLTGRTPHDPNELSRHSHDGVRRAIREEEPPQPSSRLRSLSEGAAREAAQMRGTEKAHLIRAVRGDLDAICMKALEKDRRSRYATAALLASDLQSCLLSEPISARRPSQWVRTAKFAKRNRRAVYTIGAIAFAIIASAVVSTREAMKATAAMKSAMSAREDEVRQRQQSEIQRARAESERATARLNVYVADLSLAHQSLNGGNLGRAVQLLNKHRPAPGNTDLRGWDWSYLWRLAQGDKHVSFPNLSSPAGAVAFSPSGELVAIGSQQETAICDVRTRTVVTTLPQAASQLAFLDEGKLLLTFRGGQVTLWRTEDWSKWASWREGPGMIALSLSADGTRMAIVDREGVRIRETAGWQEVNFIPDAQSPLALSSDGKTLAATTRAGVTLWPLEEGAPKQHLLAGSEGLFTERRAAFTPPMHPIAFAAGDSMIVAQQNAPSERGVFLLRIWDANSGAEVAVLPADPEVPEHTGAITSVSFSPDGRTFATTSLDHSVRLWDLPLRRRLAVLQGHRAEVVASAFSPDGQTLVTGDRAGQVKAWTVERDNDEDILADIARPVRFSADGRTLAAVTLENELVFLDAHSKEPKERLPLEVSRRSRGPVVAMSADFAVVAQGLEDGTVKFWKTTGGDMRILQVSNRPIEVLAVTADGGMLVAGSRGGALRTFDLRMGREAELPFSAGRVVVSPDGVTLAVFAIPIRPDAGPRRGAGPRFGPPSPEAGSPGSGAPRMEPVVFWDLAANEVRAKLPSDLGLLLDGAFSSDGKIFATAGSDNAIRLWNPATGASLGEFEGHKQIVNAVALSPDGQTLASASDDSTLRLWNLAARQEVLTFQRLGSSMSDLLFSPDRRLLVAAETSRTGQRQLRFWRAPRLAEIDAEE